jgi:hypothetical protein
MSDTLPKYRTEIVTAQGRSLEKGEAGWIHNRNRSVEEIDHTDFQMRIENTCRWLGDKGYRVISINFSQRGYSKMVYEGGAGWSVTDCAYITAERIDSVPMG